MLAQLVFWLAGTLLAGNFGPEKTPGFSGGPGSKSEVVEWLSETEHDFGDIRRGSLTRHAFRFKNIDNQPIVVETVRTTCGCTAAKWTETPIGPGETGEVLIEYDSEKSGAFRKKIKVFFDRQRKAEILFVAGEVD